MYNCFFNLFVLAAMVVSFLVYQTLTRVIKLHENSSIFNISLLFSEGPFTFFFKLVLSNADYYQLVDFWVLFAWWNTDPHAETVSLAMDL